MKDVKNKQIDVMIVDDHQMFIDGMKSLLIKEKNIKIVAEALNDIQALKIINSRNIDLAIIGISKSIKSGIDLIRKIKNDFSGIKVLVLTICKDKEIINEIINSEAEGYIYLCINTGKKELINAIHQIIDNGTYYCNEITSILMNDFKVEKVIEGNVKNITEREIEIIKLICKEYSSAQIAEKLFISQYTVDTHRKNILKKVNTKTLVGLMKFAIANNIIK